MGTNDSVMPLQWLSEVRNDAAHLGGRQDPVKYNLGFQNGDIVRIGDSYDQQSWKLWAIGRFGDAPQDEMVLYEFERIGGTGWAYRIVGDNMIEFYDTLASGAEVAQYSLMVPYEVASEFLWDLGHNQARSGELDLVAARP